MLFGVVSGGCRGMGIFSYTRAPEKLCIGWACNFAQSRLNYRAKHYVTLVLRCGCVVSVAE